MCRRRRRGTWSKFHFEYSRRSFRFWWRASVGFIFIGIRCTLAHTHTQRFSLSLMLMLSCTWMCQHIMRCVHAWPWHALLQEKQNRLCFAFEPIVIVHRNTLSILVAVRLRNRIVRHQRRLLHPHPSQTETLSNSQLYMHRIFLLVSNYILYIIRYLSNRPEISHIYMKAVVVDGGRAAKSSNGHERQMWFAGKFLFSHFHLYANVHSFGLNSTHQTYFRSNDRPSTCGRATRIMFHHVPVFEMICVFFLLFHFPISRCILSACLTIEWFRSIKCR